ncbi:MAG: GIY-YIG nuclease family protein [Kiritimatiellae bacterium]|nr:GIY-YIG nuclease family protein [Kiritimatiellia bacterium]
MQAKPWYVYILRCRGGSLYTGITTDLKARLAKHNAGSASAYTRTRRPVRAVYAEEQPNRSAATKREIEIKRWPREKKMALIRTGRSRLGRK